MIARASLCWSKASVGALTPYGHVYPTSKIESISGGTLIEPCKGVGTSSIGCLLALASERKVP